MLFMTIYKVKPHMPKDEFRKLMDAFAEHGEEPSVTAHYVAVDGSCAVTISEPEDATATYRSILNYTPWIEFDTKPMLTIDEALPHILDSLS